MKLSVDTNENIVVPDPANQNRIISQFAVSRFSRKLVGGDTVKLCGGMPYKKRPVTTCIFVMPFVLLSAMLFSAGCQESVTAVTPDGLIPTSLRCEYRIDPEGIDVTSPRFSWRSGSSVRNKRQTAYQVYVATDLNLLKSDKPDMWDSGRVSSDNTTEITYVGKPLHSNTVYYWKVRVWDEAGTVSGWSAPARWSMGLLFPEDFQAEWIGYEFDVAPNPLPDIIDKAKWIWSDSNAAKSAEPGTCCFRKTLTLPDDWVIKRADCYYTGDDLVRLYINGTILRSFRNKKVIYEVNLADYLNPGDNILSFLVTNEGEKASPAGFIAAIRLESEDGRVIEFTTDDNWLLSLEEHPGWKTVDYDDSKWQTASVIGPLGIEPWQNTQALKRLLPPARYFRKEFSLKNKKVKRATLYASALGIYQCFVNGQRVSDDYLSPGWTDYRRRVYYRTYDVTDNLKTETNAIGLILADGWYSGYVGGGLRRNHYGHKNRILSQLNVEYEDGTTLVIPTSKDWKVSQGPIFYADLLQGQGYDARKEMPGWNLPNFDDSRWLSVTVGDTEVDPKLYAAVTEPVRVFHTFTPVSVSEPVPGKYVFDMGQNFAGVVRLNVKGPAGQQIRIRHAERLNENGTIYTTSLRTAAATDVYICKGDPKGETWQPHLTQHGFQYVELSGLDYEPGVDAVTGLALSSDTAVTGTFSCSDEMVNKLYSNIVWTQRMNFIDLPTDCPQRDERYGWTGDAQVYINTACYNTDVQSFFTKWLFDLTDAQRADGQFPRYAPLKTNPTDGGPAWADAGVICPWTIYYMYDDTGILRTHYDAMKKYIEFNRNRLTEDYLPPEKYDCFGDWLNINDETDKDVIFASYYANSVNLFSKIAAKLGKTDDAEDYSELYQKLKTSFNKAYVQSDGKIKGDTQTAYVLAIVDDLLDADTQKLAGEHLIRRIAECDWHLSTGFVGTKDLMLALAKIGRNDVAYRLLYNDTFPSWGFSIKNGATSIWERWNGWTPENGFGDPGMNSFAHYSFGAVCQWMFENIGGIKTDGPGFKNIIIRPEPDDKLSWAKTSFDSIRGAIVSNWSVSDGHFDLDVTIPPNTRAKVYIPSGDAGNITESGVIAQNAEGVMFLERHDEYTVYKVASGSYKFTAPLKR